METETKPLIPVFTLFAYRGETRDDVNRIKVQRCVRTLDLFEKKCLAQPGLTEALDECALIIPAPSSLYSRLTGKFDLAAWVAMRLAKKFSIDLQSAPSQLFWNLQKRSRTKGRKAQEPHSLPITCPMRCTKYTQNIDEGRIILLDDVITTGHTFRKLILSTGIPQHRIALLALCDAR